MVKGRLASYAKGSGDSGAVAYVGVVDRTIIGAGATKRLTLGMTTPYYGENIKIVRALFDLGLIVSRDTPLPLRLLVSIDGATVTREFKPQALIEVEDGLYGKAVYDATALLAPRLTRSDLHRITVVYTAARPVLFEDAGLAVVYAGIDEGWYAYNMLSGALAMEPGDILAVDVELPESRIDSKTLIVKMHVPSRFAEVRVEAAGAKVEAGGITGPTIVEIPLRVKGRKTRVYIYYDKPSQKFYPNKLIVSSIVLLETRVPTANIRIVEATWTREGTLRVTVENTSSVRADDVRILVFSQGSTLASLKAGSIEPGSSAEIIVPMSRADVPSGSEALVRVMWRSYGIPGFRDLSIKLLDSNSG